MDNSPRFNDVMEIAAKFDTHAAKTDCGHTINKGDRIGYCRKGTISHVWCADCWRKWCVENAEADVYEQSLGPDFAPDNPNDVW